MIINASIYNPKPMCDDGYQCIPQEKKMQVSPTSAQT